MAETGKRGQKELRFTARPYRPEDREAVRTLCCDTGHLGRPIETVFADRRWFADLHTGYYLRFETDSCFVAETQGRIIGYILGCRHPLKHALLFYPFYALPLTLKALAKVLLGLYDAKSRAYILRLVSAGRRERPARPRRTAHFHFNVQERYRNRGVGRALIRALFRHFLKNRVAYVYGELLHVPRLREERFYTEHGFTIFDRKPTTLAGKKFGPVYWITVIACISDTRGIFGL